MSLKLSGLNPLAYMGVEPTQPPQLVIYDFVPTVNDYRNFNLGTLWLVYPSNAQTLWMLISVADFQATWVQLWPNGGGGGGATEFPTNSGTAIEVGGVLNILGDGVAVTTSGAGNTVTITALGDIGTTYVTNAGDAVPSAGILKIFGGTNINTSGTSNVVTVNLDDSITLAGNLVVEGFGIIDVGLGLTFATDGVLQVDNTGVVSATNGTNGQVLIGGGTAPVWNNITSTGGTVTITNGPNSINLETEGGGGPAGTVCFAAYQPSDLFIVPNQDSHAFPIWPYVFGTLAPMTITENEGAAFYPGDGTGTAAVFTAPVNGNYFFSVTVAISGGRSLGGAALRLQGFINYARIITPTMVYGDTDFASINVGATIDNATYSVDAVVPLTAGQQVTFDVAVLNAAANTTSPGYLFRLYGPITVTNPPLTIVTVTKILGYLI